MLHDFDYEMHPAAPHHPMKGAEILLARGAAPEVVHAILAHADYSGFRACPCLTGVSTRATSCRASSPPAPSCVPAAPSPGSRRASVKKKLKDKGFARTVNRHDVYRGAEELGVDLDEHIGFVIAALTAVAPRIGLGGPAS